VAQALVNGLVNRLQYVSVHNVKDDDGDGRLETRYSASRVAYSSYLSQAAQGRRAGGELHVAAIMYIMDHMMSMGNYCIPDLGEHDDSAADLLVVEPETYQSKGVSFRDPNLWNEKTMLAIEVETDPSKHWNQAVKNYTKNSDYGYNVWFVTFDHSHKEGLIRHLTEAGVPRDSYLLSTKWAYSRWTGLDGEPVEGDLIDDPGALEHAVDASLGRLRTDYVDVMFIHGLKPEDYDAVCERHGPAIERLRQAGKSRQAGFSERMGEDLEHRVTIDAVTRHPSFWDVSMLRYGILNQCARDRVLPLAAEHGLAVMNMSPARYLLPHPAQLAERIAAWKADGSLAPDAVPDDDPLGWLVHGEVESVVAAGMKFAADHPGVSTVLTGTRSFDHLEANIRALEGSRLPDADHERLVRLFSFAREWR